MNQSNEPVGFENVDFSAFRDFALSVEEFTAALSDALQPAFAQFYEETWKPLYEVAQRVQQSAKDYVEETMLPAFNLIYLEMGMWRQVNPHDLTPDQRWQYQKLVLSAPFRWLRDRLRSLLRNTE